MSSMPLVSFYLALAAAFTVFCGWRGARTPDLLKGPRLIPWRVLMLTGVALCLMLIVRIINLAGFETGAGRSLY